MLETFANDFLLLFFIVKFLMVSCEMSASGDEVCSAQSIIDACKEPLIGLQYVTEFKLPSGVGAPWYVCNLCEVKFMYKVIQGHVVSMKHRINYMKERFMNYHTMIYQFAKTNAEKNSLATEYAASIEEEEGRQRVRIKISESAEGSTLAAKKRPLEEKDDGCQTSSKIRRVMNAQERQPARSQSVSDKTAALVTNEIACPPKLQTVARRINFVGGGPRQGVDSSLWNVDGATTARCIFISKQNDQKSWPETRGSALISNRNVHARVTADSTGSVDLKSFPVPARHPFAQTANGTSAGSGFVDKSRLASKYSSIRKELIACFEELQSRPVTPLPSASVLRGFPRPLGVKLAVSSSANSSPLPLRTSTSAQGNGTSGVSLANTRPPLLPLRAPADPRRLQSRLHLPSAGNSVPSNNRPFPSESSTNVKPQSNYSSAIVQASGNGSFDANIGQWRAEASNSNVISHSNFSRYSNANSLHTLRARQLNSNLKSCLVKSSGSNIYTDCTRPRTAIPRHAVPQSSTGTRRTCSSAIAITEPVSLSTASKSLACVSEEHNSTCMLPAFESRNVDLGLQEAVKILACNQKIEELKPSSVTQTALLSRPSTGGSLTKDTAHPMQSSMSAISSALAKALVEYQLKKKQKNGTVQ